MHFKLILHFYFIILALVSLRIYRGPLFTKKLDLRGTHFIISFWLCFGYAQKIASPESCLKVLFIEVLLFVFSYLIFTTFMDLLSICILLKISVPLLSISCFCTSDFRISQITEIVNFLLNFVNHVKKA